MRVLYFAFHIFIFVWILLNLPFNVWDSFCETDNASDTAQVLNGNTESEPRTQLASSRDSHKPQQRLQFCNSKTEGFWLRGFEDENNTAWPWNPSITWDCPEYLYNQYPLFRRKVHLDCSTGSPHFVTTMTDSPSDIEVVEPGNKCLLSYVQNCCYDKGLLVPNVLHYVMFSNLELRFYTFVSLISVIRFMKPCAIIFHSQYMPRGKHWNYFLSVYPYVVWIKEPLVTEIFGHKLSFKEHGTDVMRIKALQEYGGLFLDWDSSLVKPVDSLRNYSFTMGLEVHDRFKNAFMMAEPNATFLTHYLNGYKGYKTSWTYNSLIYPIELSKNYPELIHVEKLSLIKPIQHEYGGPSFFSLNSDWSINYSLHVYTREFKDRDKINMETVRRVNSTLGAMCRRILFGKKEICKY